MNDTWDNDDVQDALTVEQLRQALTAMAVRPEATAACLDHDTIASLAGGTLTAAAREPAVVHLAACGACRAAVASVTRALTDPAIATELSAVERAPRRWMVRIVVPLAAAAALVLILARPRPDADQPVHRAPTITAGAVPVAVAPVGRVAGASSLRWSSIEGADRYRVTLFDQDGRVLLERELTSTSVAIPDSVSLVAGRRYLWRVDARTGFDRWSGSELIEFSVVGGPPP